MKDKEIIKQLKVLRQIKAPQGGKKERRAMFFAQIGARDEKTVKQTWSGFRIPFLAIRYMPQSMLAVFLLLFLFAGGVSGLWAARNTKPGDSLYLAKIAGEKTQFALTFNKKKKVHLGLAFAGKRAEEIRQVLADSSNDKKDAQVEKLVLNFKKEISSAKAALQKISQQKQAEKKIIDSEVAQDKEVSEDSSEVANKNTVPEEELVFSAGTEKDKNGLEVKEIGDSKQEPVQKIDKANLDFEIKDASTTFGTELSASSADIVIEESIDDSTNILAQANQLLRDDEYKEALDVLSQAEELISEALDEGAVKGIEEEATTTQLVADNPEQSDVLATTSKDSE